MAYTVDIPRPVIKALATFPPDVARRLFAKMTALGDDPRPHGYKALVGEPGYCIRDGKYRVVYDIDDAAQQVTIIKAGPRGSVYR